MTLTPTLLALALAFSVVGGAALAQADPSGGSPNTTSPNGAHGAATGGADTTVSNGATPAAPSPMTTADKRMLQRCRSMAAAAVAKDGRCKSLMGAHPELFNTDGTLKAGASPG